MTDFNNARQPKGTPAGGQFAPSAHTEPSVTLAETDSDLFDTEMGREAYALVQQKMIDEAKLNQQSAYMVDAAAELKNDWPDIKEFTLGYSEYRGDRLEITSATCVDGTQLTDDELWSASDVFKHRDSDDYDYMMDRPINVREAIAWRPGSAPAGT